MRPLTFFGLPISQNKFWLAKDLYILIYNKERKKYPDIFDTEYKQMLKKEIRKRYTAAKGTKSVDEILKEYWKEIRKKEDK
jgi:hypothetical protein